MKTDEIIDEITEIIDGYKKRWGLSSLPMSVQPKMKGSL